MSKIISDTIQGRSKDPNVNAGLTVAGVTTATGVINASSDVRISGNINAGIASFTSIAGDGSALTGVANTDFIVSVAQTTSRLTVNSDANIVGVSTFTGTTTLGQVTLGIGKSINFGNTQKAFIQGHSVGVGTTTVAGRRAGVGTATGTLIMIDDGVSPRESQLQVYQGNSRGWLGITTETLTTFNATGGTKTTDGSYTYHTFTASGSFVVEGDAKACEAFVIGGGGAGGTPSPSVPDAKCAGGGGGGAAVGPVGNLAAGTYTVTVGAGGESVTTYPTIGPTGGTGGSGGTSSFAPGTPYAITATGGGGGGGNTFQGSGAGAGGSGSGGTTNGTGGAGGSNSAPTQSGGASGNAGSAGTNAAGGGGGSGDGPTQSGGSGGNGTTSLFGPFGAGGGGGGAIDHGGNPVSPSSNQGSGGSGYTSGGNGGGLGLTATDGGGPVGGEKGSKAPTHSRNNVGGGGGSFGGGGGGACDSVNGQGGCSGGDGGGGAVIVRYLT